MLRGSNYLRVVYTEVFIASFSRRIYAVFFFFNDHATDGSSLLFRRFSLPPSSCMTGDCKHGSALTHRLNVQPHQHVYVRRCNFLHYPSHDVPACASMPCVIVDRYRFLLLLYCIVFHSNCNQICLILHVEYRNVFFFVICSLSTRFILHFRCKFHFHTL